MPWVLKALDDKDLSMISQASRMDSYLVWTHKVSEALTFDSEEDARLWADGRFVAQHMNYKGQPPTTWRIFDSSDFSYRYIP